MTARRRKGRTAELERRANLDRIHEEVIAVVKSGICPQCGSKVKRNSALTGWWQCEQFGAPMFRARPDQPPCSWQGFTS